MEKGIVMQVQLYITGEDAPAHDFTQTGHDVALQLLQAGLQHYNGPYAIKVQKVQPVEGGDDDDESSSGDALDVKPLLSYTPSTQAAPASAASSAAPSANPGGTGASSTTPASPPPASGQPSGQPSSQHPVQPEQPEEPPKHHFWDR